MEARNSTKFGKIDPTDPLQKLITTAIQHDINFELHWYPSHVGITESYKVDVLANECREQTPYQTQLTHPILIKSSFRCRSSSSVDALVRGADGAKLSTGVPVADNTTASTATFNFMLIFRLYLCGDEVSVFIVCC